ncbi:ubiG [Symbiodinium necroappetens]|uniref:UbiG protein n=1 Tax=Symbiodinium necroappetens TaxID=1628268 RepID=A0A813C4Q3_9DINO|nr:ubiG [Symbiodinium sp. CCMP2456]CAE7939421.1 ubiG [Symbiodinium necroappetens]
MHVRLHCRPLLAVTLLALSGMLVTHLASVPPESPSPLRSPWTSVMVPVICNDTNTSTAVVRRTTASELSGAVDAFSTGYRRYFVGLCNRSYTIPDLYEVFAAHSVEWAILGKTQAWWSVISVKELEGQRDLPKEQKQRFYASGIDHRDLILRDIEVNGTRPLDKTSSVLDFGCGVGRLGMAFARKFAEVTCVDQSVFHLQIAKLEWQNQKQANPESHLSYGQLDVKVSGPDLLAAVAGRRFDFVYSMIVLQHMVPPLQTVYLEQLCDILKPGGQGWVHIPTMIPEGESVSPCDLHLSMTRGGIQMHYTPKTFLEDIFRKRGCYVTVEERGSLLINPGYTAGIILFNKPRV